MIVERDGTTAGYARVEWHDLTDGDRLYESTVVVEPAASGLGITDALLEWAEARLREVAGGNETSRRSWFGSFVFDPATTAARSTMVVPSTVLGRRNAADTPALYVEVERALAPIKLVEHGEFAGRFADQKATMPWLKRFLRPDEW